MLRFFVENIKSCFAVYVFACFEQSQEAVDATCKANSSQTWKDVLHVCRRAQVRLAQMCGVNIIVLMDSLQYPLTAAQTQTSQTLYR